ncbi:MAG: hypothetical protein IH948_06745 [Bacteroidetes bacterium]|nr:hypothetical protein [Bacteroidota bacterium]
MKKGKLILLLTADYEIFGNGSGYVNHCLINPAEEIMITCERYKSRVTFFFDVCEYWAFLEVEKKGLFSEGYQPATIIKNQLQDAVRRGHDVQLHFHPQWLDYKFISDQKWELNYDYWRVSQMPVQSGGKVMSLKELFVKGKETLENMLQPISPDYKCRAFRAGAWCIQPEKEVIKVLEEVGIKYDTTVAPGIKIDDGVTKCDFLGAPFKIAQWNILDKVIEPNDKGNVIEVPIFSSNLSAARSNMYRALKLARGSYKSPIGCTGKPLTAEITKNSPKSLLVKVKGGSQMFDFCGGATFEEMRYMLNTAKRRFRELLKVSDVPVVAIGHPKNFGSSKELDKLLLKMSKRKSVRLDLLSEKSFWQT